MRCPLLTEVAASLKCHLGVHQFLADMLPRGMVQIIREFLGHWNGRYGSMDRGWSVVVRLLFTLMSLSRNWSAIGCLSRSLDEAILDSCSMERRKIHHEFVRHWSERGPPENESRCDRSWKQVARPLAVCVGHSKAMREWRKIHHGFGCEAQYERVVCRCNPIYTHLGSYFSCV